ncbi:MAG: sulfonate transport system permease protein [Gaiellaceae bacterium]|nr:sulfonate transport system permease protein [Gaiellaceae bacterium]MDX6469500.1 sulfonate transport system permease protein [Gaiellaceae bacterium]
MSATIDVHTEMARASVAPEPSSRRVLLSATGPRTHARPALFVPSVVRRAIVPALLILAWQAGSSWGWWSTAVLPSPVTVGAELGTLVGNGQLPSNLLVSLRRVVIGAGIGISLGTGLGILAGLWRPAEEALDSTLQMMRTLPYLVMLPLFVLWFGIDELPKILIISIGTSLPMYLNTFSAVRTVDPKLVEMAGSFGLGRARLLQRVVVPGALPGMLTGLRYSLGISWLSLVVAEQINARSGLGFLISNAQQFFLPSVLVVCVVVYAGLGLGTDLIVRLLERRFLAWRGSVAQW